VAAGTRNPAKIEGIRRAFERLGYGAAVDARPVETGLPDQPVGLSQVIRGAVLRAAGAWSEGYSYGVGVEAGLVGMPGTISGYVDVEACAVVDAGGRVSLGFSPAFEFPTVPVLRAVRGLAAEMEDEMVRLSGRAGLADREGGIGFLTRGAVVRPQLTEYAVLMAMVPRIRPWLYGKLPSVEEVLRNISID